MTFSEGYVLLLEQRPNASQGVKCSLEQLSCPVVVTQSFPQAAAKVTQAPPYLVILSLHSAHGSSSLVHSLKALTKSHGSMILALTDSQTPSWLYQEENPGFDGLLVQPLAGDILASLIQSAWIQQNYRSTGL
jgi:DNA-binding NarL/FixJ family response regulator